MSNLTQRISAAQQRVQILYQSAASLPCQEQILQQALEEVAILLENLYLSQEEFEHYQTHMQEQIGTIEAEKQRYQDLFASAVDGHLTTSLDGTIQQANATIAHLLGVSAKTLIGRALSLFLQEGERRAFAAQLKLLCCGTYPHRWELQLASQQGSSFIAEMVTQVVTGKTGKAQHIRWRITDITERKQQEQLRERRLAELEQRFA